MPLRPAPRNTLITVAVAALVAAAVYLVRHAPAPPATPAAPSAETRINAATEIRIADLLSEDELPAKKQEFLLTLLPPIFRENSHILVDRARLQIIADAYLKDGEISEADFNWVKALALRYKLRPQRRTDNHFFQDLLTRVDIVPPSLALAQSALESGWGASRYAQDANNFFGHTCEGEFCAAPSKPSSGDSAQPRYQSFLSEQQSVSQYMLNLNSHPAYAEFRALRASQREKNQTPDGLTLAAGLRNYSVLGNRYVEALRNMIHANNFDAMD